MAVSLVIERGRYSNKLILFHDTFYHILKTFDTESFVLKATLNPLNVYISSAFFVQNMNINNQSFIKLVIVILLP